MYLKFVLSLLEVSQTHAPAHIASFLVLQVFVGLAETGLSDKEKEVNPYPILPPSSTLSLSLSL